LYDGDATDLTDYQWISGAAASHYKDGWSAIPQDNRCAYLRVDTTSTAGWISADCNIRSPFLCQVAEYNFPYIFVSSSLNSWQDADNACMSRYGTHLASIHSEEDAGDAVYLISRASTSTTSVWMGLKTIALEISSGWVNLGANWSDGSNYDYQHWSTDQPNGAHGECGEMYRDATQYGLWNDQICTNVQPYLCANPYY